MRRPIDARKGPLIAQDGRALAPPFRSRAFRVAAAVGAALLFAVGFLPLFAGPGYEAAFAAGLILPTAAALASAREAQGASRADLALGRGVTNGLALASLGYLTVLLHGLRAGFCDAAAGSLLFALGPGAGTLVGGAWGALVGFLLGPSAGRSRGRRALPWLLAFGGPLGSALVSVGRFYTSPMVFAYDPFVGFFSGSLYDTVIEPRGLVSYRAGSLATLAAAALLGPLLTRVEGRIRRETAVKPGLVLLGLGALATSVGVTLAGPELGHYQTAGTIAEALGGRTVGERCEVLHPRAMAVEEVTRFVRDCDGQVGAVEQWLGVPEPGRPVRVFLFASTEQKAWFMGAAGTEIAKPWRREIYVHAAGFPHPSLGHELAHVLAGDLARGPFRIAASVAGLLPDPGLIEGIAVAASPKVSDLSLAQWARAMRELDLLPPLPRLFGLGFLGESSSTAYTAAGAFVTWVRDTRGGPALARWYAGEDLATVTGTSWAELEAQYLAHVATVPLPEGALAQARARFERPGVWSRACPHEVDACLGDADELLGAGDLATAERRFRDAIALDPTSGNARLGLAAVAAARRDDALATQELEAIVADGGLPAGAQDQALEQLGDRALAAGRGEEAEARYAAMAARTTDEDRLRTLDVKRAAARAPVGRDAVVALLIGTPGRGPERFRAAELLGAWSATSPDDGLPEYLLGRQYFGSGDFDQAATRLERALGRTLALPRVLAEARRLAAVVAVGRGDLDGAARHANAYAALPFVADARKAALRDLVLRGGVADGALR